MEIIGTYGIAVFDTIIGFLFSREDKDVQGNILPQFS